MVRRYSRKKPANENPSYDQKRYAARKAAGLCVKCGKIETVDAIMCPACTDKWKAVFKAHYEGKKTAGVCVSCDKESRAGRTSCKECADLAVIRRRESIEANWRPGLCRHCLKPTLNDSRNCESCLEGYRSHRQSRKSRGVCAYCASPAEPGLIACKAHSQKGKESALERRNQLRHEIIMAYGGYRCACCGITTPKEFLQIDHVNNDGNIQRRLYGLRSDRLHALLRRQGWPSGYQILCACCNVCKSRYGACLHQDPDSRLPTKYEACWRHNIKLRDAAFAAYGGYRCSCCGRTEKKFLQLDHIHEDGAEHRKQAGQGIRMYRWLRRNGYPADIVQPLCTNCNVAKAILGACPCQSQS